MGGSGSSVAVSGSDRYFISASVGTQGEAASILLWRWDVRVPEAVCDVSFAAVEWG